jgi:hypothetical protein
MQIPSYLKGEGLKTHAIALGIGAVVALALSFSWFGFGLGAMLPSTAQKMTDDKVNTEVVRLYTPECVRHFEAQADMASHWAALKKAASDYDQQDFIEKAGFATPPGTKQANDDVATACVDKLMTDLKKVPGQQAKNKS